MAQIPLSRAKSIVRAWPAVVSGAVGMWLAFAPMIGSRLARVQVDWGDTRLNNYILEHGFRWMLRMPGHRSLWSPPVFFPASNTGAYSDILLGVAPMYWFWRVAGFAPDTAFQLWMMAMGALNFIAALVCCRRILRVGWPAAALGAFVFSFGSTRIAQLKHQQLLGQFYWLIALYAVVRIFDAPVTPDDARRADARRPMWIAVTGASMVLQMYAGYYLGWFLGFTLGLGLAWSLILPATRQGVIGVVRRSWRALIVTACGAALALVPLAIPYVRAAHDVGLRSYGTVTWYLPRVWSWVFEGPQSWLYGWMFRYPQFTSIPEGTEHHLGIGLVTTALAIMGLWGERRRPTGQLLIACSATILFLCTIWPNGASAWVAVYHLVPGAGAIRGVSRIALALLIPAAVGLAWWVERSRRWPLLLAGAAAVVVAEQRQSLQSYDKAIGRHRVDVVAAAVRPECLAFLYTPDHGTEDPWWYQTDAMWASLKTGVPTINGYSGNTPPQWHFYLNIVGPASHDSAIDDSLRIWAARWSLDLSRLCRIKTPAPD